jgi:hypothetical protein
MPGFDRHPELEPDTPQEELPPLDSVFPWSDGILPFDPAFYGMKKLVDEPEKKPLVLQ